MSNDSSTGGYLSQTSAPPLEDDALDDFFQAVVVAITGLSGQYVRPRFQQTDPGLPDVGVNWAAVGVMPDSKADTYPYVSHDQGAANGEDTLIRNEELNVLASFYGPNAKGNASLLRDGLAIAQNREALFSNQMGLVEVGGLTRAPELIKNLWLNRWDVPIVIRRAITRTFAVLNIATVNGTLIANTATGVIVETIGETIVVGGSGGGSSLDFSQPSNSQNEQIAQGL